MTPAEINLPDVLAEVKEAFARYETALTTNDVITLDALFHQHPGTIRYGATENLYGYDAIARFRAGRNPANLMRDLAQTAITSYGRDMAVACTLFTRSSAPDKIGRQMQTWIRFAEGWRIVAAHVSVIDAPSI